MTGFEPFGGEQVNASGDAVAALAATWGERAPGLATAILPVSFDGAPIALREAIERVRPDFLVCVGEAGGRAAVTPERFAVNDRCARIPDNDGLQPSGPIDDGPRVLAGGIDPDLLTAAIRRVGVPAATSEDAGRFVCNATFRAALTCFNGPATFVHVPAVRPAGSVAGVGGETDPMPTGVTGRHGLTVGDLARALAAVLGVLN